MPETYGRVAMVLCAASGLVGFYVLDNPPPELRGLANAVGSAAAVACIGCLRVYRKSMYEVEVIPDRELSAPAVIRRKAYQTVAIAAAFVAAEMLLALFLSLNTRFTVPGWSPTVWGVSAVAAVSVREAAKYALASRVFARPMKRGESAG